MEFKEIGRETGKEADCQVQWKVHRMCLEIVPWFSCCPFLCNWVRGSLRAGALPGTSACPGALFCHSTEHEAMCIQTGLSGKEAATEGSEHCLVLMGPGPGKWAPALCLGDVVVLADPVTQLSLGTDRNEATFFLPTVPSLPCVHF